MSDLSGVMSSLISSFGEDLKRNYIPIFIVGGVACMAFCFAPVAFLEAPRSQFAPIAFVVGVCALAAAVVVPIFSAARRKVERINAEKVMIKRLSNLPHGAKAVLMRAVEEGLVHGNIRNPEIAYLYRVGVLIGPPQLELMMGDDFMVDPIALDLLGRHWDEVFAER